MKATKKQLYTLGVHVLALENRSITDEELYLLTMYIQIAMLLGVAQ